MSEVYTVTTDGLADSYLTTLLSIGNLSVQFSDVKRAPRYPDGSRESDVEHSFHLGLSAIELASEHYPDLNVGLVAQFSYVHDLPELHTGDVRTYDISDDDRQKKEEAEQQAIKRLLADLPPGLSDLLRRYEEQIEPEARFVRLVDKLMPGVINIIASDASTFFEDYGRETIEQHREKVANKSRLLASMFPEFPIILDLHLELVEAVARSLYKA